MKLTKIIATGVLGFGLATANLYALDTNERLELLENAVIEQASTPAQKSAVSEYLANVAKEKTELAQALRDRAQVSHGGKVISQINEKRDLIRRAEALEKEAQKYKKVSMSFAEAGKQVASN
ncbi:LIC_10421 family protein [Leptospira sp. 'Mane']|uniref:LIC_10421 family protein n=1 Tax=Leptospira sp. 'Mane' TaxID=3387407 RepID=UPI00398B7F1D